MVAKVAGVSDVTEEHLLPTPLRDLLNMLRAQQVAPLPPQMGEGVLIISRDEFGTMYDGFGIWRDGERFRIASDHLGATTDGKVTAYWLAASLPLPPLMSLPPMPMAELSEELAARARYWPQTKPFYRVTRCAPPTPAQLRKRKRRLRMKRKRKRGYA